VITSKELTVKNENLTSQDALAWLNGRVTSPIIVTHRGESHVLWTNEQAVTEGLTIEDAIVKFFNQHNIYIDMETNP
jgi:hypothetical protein